VIFAGLEKHAVPGADHLDRRATTLAEADTLREWIVCPNGWVCHAVRAPGANRTQAAASREGAVGVAIVSM
jgi:hypothetical protein